MSAHSTSRALARTTLQHGIRSSGAPSTRCSPFLCRSFASTPINLAEPPKKNGPSILTSLYGSSAPRQQQSTSPPGQGQQQQTSPDTTPSGSQNMMDLLRGAVSDKFKPSSGSTSFGRGDGPAEQEQMDALEPFHFHIYSHKHNTHVTVTKPDRGAIISMSTGNIGFRKGRRKQYDAAYQLTAYVLERLKYAGWENKIRRMALVLRGFGQGREAGVKVLMSPEGATWREKVVSVADSTRLKFGGTRSKNPRRL